MEIFTQRFTKLIDCRKKGCHVRNKATDRLQTHTLQKDCRSPGHTVKIHCGTSATYRWQVSHF